MNKPSDILKEGQEVQVRVLNVEKNSQRISLSLRGMTSDEHEEEGTQQEGHEGRSGSQVECEAESNGQQLPEDGHAEQAVEAHLEPRVHPDRRGDDHGDQSERTDASPTSTEVIAE